jgi:ribosomal protein S17
MAHDPENKTQMGDTVVVEEHPPLSAKKRWILKTILK